MPSFEDVLKSEHGNSFENRVQESLESRFLQGYNSFVNEAVSEYTKYGRELNQTITRIAKENKLNREQIKRVAEEANVRVYLQKYANTKGQTVRRVEFELADAEKVASALGLADSGEKVASTVTSSGEMSKAASYDDPGIGTNFLNSSDNYEPGLWDSEQLARVKKDVIASKVLSKIAAAEDRNYSHTKLLLYKIARIGDALISYARIGEDPQVVFESLSHDAGLDKAAQQPIKEYTMEKVAELKKASRLPSNAMFQLNLVDMKYKQAYELGEHSLMKKADDIVVRVPPDVISPQGHLIQYSDLVDLAKEVTADIAHSKDLKRSVAKLKEYGIDRGDK